MTRPPPISTLFPYTTLFRSLMQDRGAGEAVEPVITCCSQGDRGGRAPLSRPEAVEVCVEPMAWRRRRTQRPLLRDRKSTRLNSSHPSISYAVFCLKKKKKDT